MCENHFLRMKLLGKRYCLGMVVNLEMFDSHCLLTLRFFSPKISFSLLFFGVLESNIILVKFSYSLLF